MHEDRDTVSAGVGVAAVVVVGGGGVACGVCCCRFPALLLLPPPLPPLLILAMPSQLPVAMLIIPAAFVAASAGAAVAVPSPSPFVSLAIALIPRRSFSPQACYGASHCALHNEWGQNGPPKWE